MVKYLKTKKGYFYKFKKNGEKKRISQEEYNKKNKTRKNKMIGGGVIDEIEKDTLETEFEQKNAIINYGKGPISTYNLVNCIAIGGVFKINENSGTFLTHESPTDYLEQITKLTRINTILKEKKAIITQIILFRIDEPSQSIYANGFTTENIIELMVTFCENLFKITPIIHKYSCDISTMRCGKATLSPTSYSNNLVPLRFTSPPSKTVITPSGNFIVKVLTNKSGEKIYECPICNSITGTLAPKIPSDTSLFSHKYGCINQNKIPIEPVQKLDEV